MNFPSILIRTDIVRYLSILIRTGIVRYLSVTDFLTRTGTIKYVSVTGFLKRTDTTGTRLSYKDRHDKKDDKIKISYGYIKKKPAVKLAFNFYASWS
ncbi:hypothetical protein LDJ79_20245 [Vibrio tritonius]|uniref:Uncharacterized protein n=1 Tax=Vibrio tritonius TaxID=1435069 RepID=A0ABS7YS12_9VIBR|nr:hypothetical protein [Vibrio tritonius]MCA2018458.1 hypothetical protein [Vibrio tritonius]